MRRIAPALVFALLASPVLGQGVKSVDQAWTKAIKAGDLAALTALYTEDAVMYPPDEAKAKGREAIRASFEKLLAANTVQEAVLTYDTFRTVGNLSYASGNFRLTMAPKAGGDPQTFEGRFTSIAERKGGKWLYVSDHASVPLPPPPPAQ
jgi:uncharacterized protein (TIGR02246 family)